MNPNFPMIMPMIMPNQTQAIDMNQMQQILMSNQLMMAMGITPNFQNVNGNGNNGIPLEKKA